MIRLTITRKIALAVIGIVVLCVGTMAWLTSQNLQRGFIAYLNEVQAQELDELGGAFAAHYRERGNFELLRHNPPAIRELLDRRAARMQAPDGRRPPRPDPNRPPPPPARDPMGLGPRLSMTDADGRPVFGPPDPPDGATRAIVVDGRAVGTLSLAPMRQLGRVSDSVFVRSQIRDILWLAAGLILVSTLLAVWLARQLLRPVAALRSVTQRIAQGQFDARAPVLSRDELAELAQYVNTMAQALEVNEQQRRKMLADVSHELRTPLTVIRGEIEALQDGIRQADGVALESLHVEVLRLNKLVDDLHQLALSDTGDLHYQRQRVDMTALLGGLLERYRARATQAHLALISKLPDYATSVLADPGRLTQVIGNLFENSLRYTDAGGTVGLSLSRTKTHAELCIEDSAPGVPAEALPKLFERLYRVDQARSRERGGSGLGLSICKALVESHGGDIVAKPSALGGIKVMVRLPLIDSSDH